MGATKCRRNARPGLTQTQQQRPGRGHGQFETKITANFETMVACSNLRNFVVIIFYFRWSYGVGFTVYGNALDTCNLCFYFQFTQNICFLKFENSMMVTYNILCLFTTFAS